MNRSVINGEVEYHLRRQEQERARHHHDLPELEAARPGLLARLLASLKRNRTQRPPLDWERAGRRVPGAR
jgi:hypothetical protein